MVKKRLAVPVHAAMARSSRLPRTKDRPSPTSRSRCRSGGRCGTGSRDAMDPTQAADQRKDSASSSTAYGAVSAWTSTPPSAGPATWATDWVPCSFALPSTRWSRPTRCGR